MQKKESANYKPFFIKFEKKSRKVKNEQRLNNERSRKNGSAKNKMKINKIKKICLKRRKNERV